MSDNEIIHALAKILQRGDAPIGEYWGVILTKKLLSDTIELLKRQQAEIDRLELVLSGVMHFVDKWLDDEELEQDETARAITMREKTLRIVEGQQAEIKRLEKGNLRDAMIFNGATIKAATKDEIQDFLNALKECAYVATNEWSHGGHPTVVEWEDILAVFDERFGEIK